MTRKLDVRTAIGRREVLLGGLAGLVGITPLVGARPAWALARTPAQTEGPFYPDVMPLDLDADLVRVTGKAAQAMGTVAHVFGRVNDSDGRPIAGAQVEIWQCDANGRYIATGDRRDPPPRDGNFQGFGKLVTGADGLYRFRTIRPVVYPGRAPHIHFAIRVPGRGDLITQLYIAGEPANLRDRPFNGLSPAEQALVTAEFRPAPELEAGAERAEWNIVVG